MKPVSSDGTLEASFSPEGTFVISGSLGVLTGSICLTFSFYTAGYDILLSGHHIHVM